MLVCWPKPKVLIPSHSECARAVQRAYRTGETSGRPNDRECTGLLDCWLGQRPEQASGVGGDRTAASPVTPEGDVSRRFLPGAPLHPTGPPEEEGEAHIRSSRIGLMRMEGAWAQRHQHREVPGDPTQTTAGHPRCYPRRPPIGTGTASDSWHLRPGPVPHSAIPPPPPPALALTPRLPTGSTGTGPRPRDARSRPVAPRLAGPARRSWQAVFVACSGACRCDGGPERVAGAAAARGVRRRAAVPGPRARRRGLARLGVGVRRVRGRVGLGAGRRRLAPALHHIAAAPPQAPAGAGCGAE